jgi:hypothetical protein
LNAAFNLASGAVSSAGMAVWALPGLLSPDAMTLTFAGMVASVGLASPWGLLTSSGIVVRAHGTQTGANTTSYSVNFAPVVPGSGAVIAYLAATVTTIQQDSFPLTGPPQGHPSFNPNFVPSVAYATTAYTITLAATTTLPDNITTFELARATLTAGQVTIASYSTIGWQRATPFTPVPAAPVAIGGVLTLAQAVAMIVPTVGGLTSTLPPVASGGGLSYRVANPSSSTGWQIAASTGDTIVGAIGTPVTNMSIPPYGAATIWGNAASGIWEITSVNPLMMAALPNNFTAPQTITDSSLGALSLVGTGTNGVNLGLTGNGTVTPRKTLRVINGLFQIINNAYTAVLMTLDDSGNFTVPGMVTGGSLTTSGAATVGGGLAVTGGGVNVTSFDPGGLNIRTSAGTGAGAGFRNDGASFYLLMSNAGNPNGGFNGFRPFVVNLSTGALLLDATGVGITCGGPLTTTNIIAGVGNVGGVAFPGGGIINTNGAIDTTSALIANTVNTTGNITTNNGRLRAAFGARGSGDLNAAVILGDYVLSNVGVGGVLFFPNGFILQWGVVNVPANGSNPTLFNLPTAFPNSAIQITGSFGAHTPPQQAVGFDLANNAQFWATNTSTAGVGNGCYFLAIGT